MNKRSIVIYIATSIDGYIAKEDGDISWLSAVQTPGEDYGYSNFIKTIDTVIMGRKTYEKVLSFGLEYPHRGRKTYVISKSKSGKDENAEYYNGELSTLIESLQKAPGKDIYCDGGAELISSLMMLGLIDRFIISTIPILLGGGIPLFRPGFPTLNLKLAGSNLFPSGLIQNEYLRQE